MSAEKIIWEAEFNPAVRTYWLMGGAIALTVCVVTIPLLPIWFLVGYPVTQRYLASHRCVLTSRSLKFAKGLLVKQEKTVPLDRITDLGLVQGPIMRMMDLEAIRVETAGQSSPGSLIQLTGIKNGRAFRDAVLSQRDLVVGSEEERGSRTEGTQVDQSANTEALLVEIRDVLLRMEASQDADRNQPTSDTVNASLHSEEID